MKFKFGYRYPANTPLTVRYPNGQSKAGTIEELIYDEEDLECTIFMDEFVDPVMPANCEHTFEKASIEHWVASLDHRDTRDCPHCRAYISRYEGDLGEPYYDYRAGVHRDQRTNVTNHLVPDLKMIAAIAAFKSNNFEVVIEAQEPRLGADAPRNLGAEEERDDPDLILARQLQEEFDKEGVDNAGNQPQPPIIPIFQQLMGGGNINLVAAAAAAVDPQEELRAQLKSLRTRGFKS